FTGAYWALFGDRVFDDFKQRVLERNLQRSIEVKVLSNAIWLWSAPRFKRSDLAAELYDETIFDGKTYGDLLARRKRPFLIVNATNVSTGDRFEFTQDEFYRIGSDLRTFPVSRAIAASAAFPFAFSTITVRNHASLGGATGSGPPYLH